MYYKKTETYSFSVPKEYSWYCEYKQQLQDAGVRFTESGGNSMIEIQVVERARFKRDDGGSLQMALRSHRKPADTP